MQVSVPCSSMSMVVTVRCGHCTSLLSVNMMKASFVPLHLLASFSHDDEVFMRVFKLSFNYIYLRIKSKTKIIYVHKWVCVCVCLLSLIWFIIFSTKINCNPKFKVTFQCLWGPFFSTYSLKKNFVRKRCKLIRRPSRDLALQFWPLLTMKKKTPAVWSITSLTNVYMRANLVTN